VGKLSKFFTKVYNKTLAILDTLHLAVIILQPEVSAPAFCFRLQGEATKIGSIEGASLCVRFHLKRFHLKTERETRLPTPEQIFAKLGIYVMPYELNSRRNYISAIIRNSKNSANHILKVLTLKILGFHGGDYEEWCLLGCYAVWLL
jgi:hypothetical protein